MEATRLKPLKVAELIVKGAKAKPRILVKEDIWADSIIRQVV